jgi:hypothetical protein
VELFAPLSTTACSSPKGRALLKLASQIAWLLVGVGFLRMLLAPGSVLISNGITRAGLHVFVLIVVGKAWLSSSGTTTHGSIVSTVPHILYVSSANFTLWVSTLTSAK